MRKETIDAAQLYTAEHKDAPASQRNKLLYLNVTFHQRSTDMAVNDQICKYNGKPSYHTKTAGCHYTALNRFIEPVLRLLLFNLHATIHLTFLI